MNQLLNTKNDYVSTTLIKEKATPKITKLDTTKLWLQTECDDCKENEKKKEFLKENYFKLKTPDTIHIYSDGKMDKVNFKNLLFGKKLKYIYVDKDGNHHKVCECELYETWKMGSGKSDSTLIPSATEKASATVIDYVAMGVSGVDAHKTWVLTNNDVYTKGELIAGYTHLYYKASTEKVVMVTIPSNLNYRKNDLNIKFEFKRTLRKFSSPEIFAAFIGVLAECSYVDVVSEGSSYRNGSSYPSKTHNNGFAIDTWYFGPNRNSTTGKVNSLDLTKQQDFMDAFKKFGFDDRIKGSDNKCSNLTNYTLKNGNHNGHLHCGKLNPNYK
ncbi:MAG: hypothetical protein L3J23_05000 [Flavobacteriaceae bacterium]|nr:hypothetical protein [Flavobacteriaceae bacterium]